MMTDHQQGTQPMIPFNLFRRKFSGRLTAACLAAALTGTAFATPALAASDEVPDMQMSQAGPVWEPGDPVPGGGTASPAVETAPDKDSPEAARDATVQPLQAPYEIPGAIPGYEIPGYEIPGAIPGAVLVPEKRMTEEPVPDAARALAPVAPPDAAATSAPVAAPVTMTEAEKPATAAPAAESEASDPQDFLCSRAPQGTTVPVPAPFNRWLVRVCSPQGQALVPVLGEAWVAHGSVDPVSILAMPPGAVPPPNIGAFDARYGIRFEVLEGGQTTGERREQALALLKTASGGQAAAPDEVWQLDAVSNVAATRYNLFFYTEGERPGHIIACLDQCRQALYLDVLRGAEAQKVLRP